jgi:hypothetical protein
MALYLASRDEWPDLYVEAQEFGSWVQNSSFSTIGILIDKGD